MELKISKTFVHISLATALCFVSLVTITFILVSGCSTGGGDNDHDSEDCNSSTSKWDCKSGICECQSGPRSGQTCTDPDLGPDPSSCDVFCEYCTSAPCACDVLGVCDEGCKCDPLCPECICDTSSSCQTGCDCDPDCSGCTCDTSSSCDSGCSCDPDCSACPCNVTASCDDGCECDSQCSGDVICTDGSEYDCSDEGEHWTGEKCCVSNVSLCVEGDIYDCDETGEHWTGEQCCVSNVSFCVEEDILDCNETGEHWTGELCCVEGVSSCTEGTIYECEDSGGHWTGDLCCV